jgi:uncharacterized protein DUF1616
MTVSPVLALLGILLVFVLPGLGAARALFPEWRFRGPDGLVHVVETAALSLVLSVALTILVGFGLLNTSGGFSASWSDPALEGILAGITVAGFALAALRGAFSRVAPNARPLERLGGEEGGAESLQRAEDLLREERRLRHALRVSRDSASTAQLQDDLTRVRSEVRRLGSAREEEYAR